MRRIKDSYRSLVDHLPDGLAHHEIVLDTDGKPVDYVFLDANPAFEALTGLHREQIRGRRATDVIPGIERTAFDWIGAYGRVALGGPSTRFEQFLEPLGRWYEVTVFSDQPGFFTTVFRNITERKQMEDELRAGEVRFRSLFDHSLDAIYIGRPDGTIVDVNQAWLNLFGYKLEDLPGLNASAFYADPADRADFVRRISEQGFVRDEVRYRRKDGTIFDCQRVQVALKDEEGRVLAYQGVIRDVTDDRRRRDALADELARRRILLEQSRDGIVTLDQDGKVVEANLRFAEMLGRSPEELLQLHVWDWDVPHPESTLKEMVRTVDESGDHFETQHRRKDGTIYDVEISTNATEFRGQKLVFCVCRDITERKRVQKALEQSEASLRFLTEHTADIIWTMDMEFRTTYMSPSVERVLGFTAEEWMRLRFDEVATPESVGREYAVMQQQLALEASGTADPNRTVTLEVEMYHKNGSTVWMELVMRAIRDDAGKLVGMVGVSRDITERRKTIAAMRDSEQRFRSLFEQSLDAIYIVAPDGRILEANEAWLHLFGYTREDLATLKAVDVYAEPGARDGFLKRIAEAGYVKDAIRLKKKDGTLFDCERSVVALRDQSGTLVAYQGVQRDVTERERARRGLQESESKFRALFEHSMDAISLVSPGGLLLEANEAYLDLFGYTQDDIGKLNVEHQYVDEEARTAFLEWMSTHESALDQEVRLRRRDGTEMDCLRNAVVRRDSDGNIIGEQSVIHDITAQKKAEEALRRSEAYNRSIVEVIPDLIIRVNTKGELLDIVASSDAELAVPRDQAAGKRIADILSEDDAVRAQKAIEEALRTDSLQTMEYQLELPSGKRWFEARYLPSGRTEVVALIRDITERKQAEEELRESEERFSQLAEQSRTWAWEVDFEGLYTYVDMIAEQVIGYRPGELVGKKHFYDLHPEAQREEYKTAGLQIVQSGGELAQFENPVVSKDGRTLWFSTSGIPLLGDDGHVLGYRGWNVDITAQRQVALALGESEARFRSLFEQSWDAIYVGTPEGTIMDVNQAWLDLFGYSPDDLSHITVLDLYAEPSDRSQFLRRIAREGRIRDEVRYKKKDGTVFDCERTVVVRTDARGNAIAYQGIFRDVSRRNRDRAELERLAQFDALTGVMNRRSLLEKVVEWIAHVRRYGGSLTVVMLDLDHFKQVNDLHGHQVGDRVLTETAGVLQRSVRQTDFVGRYGGEEFLLILPRTDAAGAAVIAERARIMLQGTAMHDAEGGAYAITASFGVAEWRDGDNVDALVSRADAAMYRAKANGRNRVEVAPCPELDASGK